MNLPPGSRLMTRNNLVDPDAVYRAFVEAHRGLSDAESAILNAKLVLILANHVGDPTVISEAIALARGSGTGDRSGT